MKQLYLLALIYFIVFLNHYLFGQDSTRANPFPLNDGDCGSEN